MSLRSILFALSVSATAACGGPQPTAPAPAPRSARGTAHVSPVTKQVGLAAVCEQGVAAVAAGWSHTCVTCTGGTIACWGTNYLGNLGMPMPTERDTPALVPDVEHVAAVAAGSYHTCARHEAGTVTCWGANQDGQLGDDTTATRLHAVPVVELAGVEQLDVGFGPGHTCAVVTGGGVRCWGVNFNGQLGDGTMTNRASPTPVRGLDDAVQVSAGAYHTCAVRRGGTVACWGGKHGRRGAADALMQLQEVPGLADAKQVAAGGEHTCALRATGEVACWGMNGTGQLGIGTWADQVAPVAVPGLEGVTAIDAASHHTCAITAARGVACWGANEHGQLGDGTTTASNVPVAVKGLAGVRSISVGHRSSCALDDAGEVVCWGELALPTAETP